MDCIFCKIIAGDIPSKKVFEDDFTLAFLDVHPVSLGHTLVVPKAHATDLRDTTDSDVAHAFTLAKRIGSATMATLGADGFNIGVNTGAAAGQIVMHTHLHVIPRHHNDGLVHWPKATVTPEEMDRAGTLLSQSVLS